MKERIIQIIGNGMERERAECMADQIIEITAEFISGIRTALQYNDIVKAKDTVELFEDYMYDRDMVAKQYHCIYCGALDFQDCICNDEEGSADDENDDLDRYQESEFYV